MYWYHEEKQTNKVQYSSYNTANEMLQFLWFQWPQEVFWFLQIKRKPHIDHALYDVNRKSLRMWLSLISLIIWHIQYEVMTADLK